MGCEFPLVPRVGLTPHRSHAPPKLVSGTRGTLFREVFRSIGSLYVNYRVVHNIFSALQGAPNVFVQFYVNILSSIFLVMFDWFKAIKMPSRYRIPIDISRGDLIPKIGI